MSKFKLRTSKWRPQHTRTYTDLTEPNNARLSINICGGHLNPAVALRRGQMNSTFKVFFDILTFDILDRCVSSLKGSHLRQHGNGQNETKVDIIFHFLCFSFICTFGRFFWKQDLIRQHVCTRNTQGHCRAPWWCTLEVLQNTTKTPEEEPFLQPIVRLLHLPLQHRRCM
jgi:hypothetical protein